MWMALGGGAVVFALLNLMRTFQGKDAKWFGFAGLSLTVLTVCACYSDEAMRVANEDWSGLMDIMPTMSKALWVCVIISILLNAVPVFSKKSK